MVPAVAERALVIGRRIPDAFPFERQGAGEGEVGVYGVELAGGYVDRVALTGFLIAAGLIAPFRFLRFYGNVIRHFPRALAYFTALGTDVSVVDEPFPLADEVGVKVRDFKVVNCLSSEGKVDFHHRVPVAFSGA